MHMNIYRFLTIFLLLFFKTSFIISQTVSFNNITTEDGLSQLSVNSIYIDESGMLWIATRSGLNLYDGNHIYTFKTEKDNPQSISSNFILQVTGNKNGNIYILSTDGISEYNMQTKVFTKIYNNKAGCIYYYGNKLYIGSGNTIYTYDFTDSLLKKVSTLPNDIQNINSIIIDNNDYIWLGTDNGIYNYDTNTDSTLHIVKIGNITKLFIDSANNIWAGSWDNGLFCITPEGKVNNYRNNNKEKSISSDFTRAISEDNLGNIWIGTSKGIDKYNKKTGEFKHYTSGDSEYSLTHSSVWCIEKDEQGTLWIGTYFGGVNYINPEYSIYTSYTMSDEEGKGLSSPIVGRIIEDDKSNLWIGTEGGGLNYLDRTLKSFKWYSHTTNKTNSISHNNIKALFFDKETYSLWIGTHTGGLNKLDINSGKFVYYKSTPKDKTTIPSDIVRDIEPYTKDSIIIATQNGICIMNKSNGICRQILNNLPENQKLGMIADITLDKNNNLWIAATGEGVYVYNIKNGSLKNYRHSENKSESISSNNINNITIDNEGEIWLCTSGSGLDIYRPETDSFINFDSSNSSLSNNCIYQACQSPVTGNILLITTDGFSVFDKKEKTFRNYNSDNGFPLKALNENALYISQNGEVFLGGIHNMVSFYEKDLRRKYKPYHIVPTKLLINGKYIRVGDKEGILKKSIAYTDTILLNHKQNMISLEFAVTNYIAANKDKIIYKLEGLSNEWNDTRGKNEITYTNLTPGNYKLIIKPKDIDNSICQPIELQIIIKAAFYQTTLAYILYILITILILWYIITIYLTRLHLSESLKLEQMHADNIRKENEAQLRLFTSISHEFRTPLTLIISQIETLVHEIKPSQRIYSKLSTIYQNSVQLRELITELLDYRKYELGYLKLQVSKSNIVQFIKENYLLFNDYAARKNIDINFSSSENEIELWFDHKNMQKVINNLLFNAIKHTQSGGKISITLTKEINNVVITINDNGEGIPEKDINKIFDIFYQSENSQTSLQYMIGSGIGLSLVKNIIQMHHGNIKVKSKLNVGSTFILTLPLGNEHFKPEEITNEYNWEICAHHTPIPTVNYDERTDNNSINGEFTPTDRSENKPDMLIVEDNRQICEMLEDILSPYYNIHTASSAEKALEHLEGHISDIVITDVMMSGMDGKELCKRIKTSAATSHIPVIILTAQTAVEQYIEGFQTGADDYITKPFNTQMLISRCNNLVNSRKLLQEKFSHKPDTSVQMLATNKIDKEILDKAISIIEDNISNVEFNMNTFAREMGMARTNLFTKIKAITGETPNDFIVSIRLKKGAYLLKNNPELNITEIAEKLGFSSARYFSKCFKDMYNISPLSYRKGSTEHKDSSE